MKPYVWNGENEKVNYLKHYEDTHVSWLEQEDVDSLVKEIKYLRECKDGAYWERNVLALLLAKRMNDLAIEFNQPLSCGYYVHGEWKGWSRVVSIDYGAITFHVPDDFDLGSLPLIKPNYDGHSTYEKWIGVMEECGCKIEEEIE